MSLQFEGKVAFITGAARGQGRSHAVRFAEDGADIIAFDLCDQIDSVAYPMATRDDLDETVNLVEKTGRRIVAEQGDVRDLERLKAAVANGVAELGRVDFVLANAGIMPAAGEQRYEMSAYIDAVDVLLNGVYYTVEAALPAMLEHGEGGAIVITSSVAGLNSVCPRFSVRSHGYAGYHAAKHGVVGLMRYYATTLAEKNIRVNTSRQTRPAMNDLFKNAPRTTESNSPLAATDRRPRIAGNQVYDEVCFPAGSRMTEVAGRGHRHLRRMATTTGRLHLTPSSPSTRPEDPPALETPARRAPPADSSCPDATISPTSRPAPSEPNRPREKSRLDARLQQPRRKTDRGVTCCRESLDSPSVHRGALSLWRCSSWSAPRSSASR